MSCEPLGEVPVPADSPLPADWLAAVGQDGLRIGSGLQDFLDTARSQCGLALCPLPPPPQPQPSQLLYFTKSTEI